MKKLGANIEALIADLAGDSEQARINLRAHQVRDRYRAALESVYPATACIFLDHTNNVYITKLEGVPTLIVYVDESIYAAELSAQRELIKLRLLELFGENVEEFRIYVSRARYKQNYPYRDQGARTDDEPPSLPALDDHDQSSIEELASKIDDEEVRNSFEKAMTADIARKIVENGRQS